MGLARAGSGINQEAGRAAAILGHPDKHRPAPMQVHAHDLRAVVRFHQGPPIVVDDVDTPSMNARDSYGERGGPAPSWHQEP